MIIDRIDEEFLLFSLHRDGRWVSKRVASITHGVAGAWLTELLIEGRLKLDGQRIRHRGRSAMDDEVLDWVLESVRSAKRPRRVTTWIRRLSRQAGPRVHLVMKRLEGRGYVDHRRVFVGTKRVDRYPQHTAEARQELRKHLIDALFERSDPDERTLALLAVLDGAGLCGHIFGDGHGPEASRRVAALLARDSRLKTVHDAIRRRRWTRWVPFL